LMSLFYAPLPLLVVLLYLNDCLSSRLPW